VHLVGIVTKKFVTMHGHMKVNYVMLGNVSIVSCSFELMQLLAKEISTIGLG